MFGREDFEKLAPVIDAFSLMTYDFSGPGRLDTHYRNVMLMSLESLLSLCNLRFFLSFLLWTLINLLEPKHTFIQVFLHLT